MGDHSGIEWTDATWNPLTGCTRVSAGCDNCYAARQSAGRLKNTTAYRGLAVSTPSGRAAFNGRIRLLPERLDQPLRWQRPRRVFVNSMSDLFHDGVPHEYIAAVFGVIAASPQHTFQVLTKRPERAAEFFAWLASEHTGGALTPQRKLSLALHDAIGGRARGQACIENATWPLPNAWIGTSVEHQDAADERIPHLLRTPAAVRFLSCEPLLGPINFRWRSYAPQATGETYREYLGRNGGVNQYESLRGINWVIAGGESGPGARPLHPDWARSLRDQCEAAGVPFFWKQWGEWAPDCLCGTRAAHRTIPRPHPGRLGVMFHCGKKRAGRRLDGREWNEMPKREPEREEVVA